MKAERTFFPNLDGLRFLAFFAVYLTHCFSANTLYVKHSYEYEWATSFFSNGELGVSFFFVLSGFLITYLLLEEEATNGRVSVIPFYVRRFLRIWPLFFACVLFGFVVYPLLARVFLHRSLVEQGSVLYYLTFASNFDILWNSWPTAPPLGVLWSISVEEQFYLIWPIVLIIIKARKAYALLGIVLLSFFFRCMFFKDELILYLHTLSVISDMAIGGLLAFVSFSVPSFRQRIYNLTSLQIASVYLGGILIIIFRESWTHLPVLKPLERILFAVFFAFIIVEQNYARRSFLKAGSVKWLSKWGKYTYGLYCLHILAIIFVDNVFTLLNINDYRLSIVIFKPLLSLSIAMIISWISYHYFEEYFLRMKKAFRPLRSDRIT